MSILASMTSGINAAATSGNSDSSTDSSTTDTTNSTMYNPLDVSDEVSKITNQNSLAMRSAKALGNQAAASRGMQNSTLGAEAAQRAMLDAALPMAQQNVSQAHNTKMQEDSVRANTVGAYLDAAKELQTSFFDAYKEIQASEIDAGQKSAAIADLYNKQQQQLNAMKSMYQNLATTESDWSNFADLIS